jgi:hypothetical protein
VLLLYSRPEAHSRLSPFVPKKFAKMHSHSLPLAALSLLSSSALAAPAAVPELYADGVQQLGKRLTISPYQPVSAACPDTPLVRNATEIGSEESAYISSSKDRSVRTANQLLLLPRAEVAIVHTSPVPV